VRRRKPDTRRRRHVLAECWRLRGGSRARRHIGSEVDRRIRAALGTSAWPEVVNLFGFGLYGAVLQANYSAASADELADQLTDLVDVVFSQSA
jgi:hypothetical protein